MSWNIAQAKQRFSEVVRLTAEEPQMIYNRHRCVAAVVDAETFRQFDEWRKVAREKTLGEWFVALRKISAAEGYELPGLARSEIGRPNPFITVLEEWEADDKRQHAA